MQCSSSTMNNADGGENDETNVAVLVLDNSLTIPLFCCISDEYNTMIRLILAGILSIPCFLLWVATAPLIAILSIPSLLLLVFRKEGTSSSKKPTHVVVFGGSKGIGLAIAKECASKKLGGNLKITILARNQEILDKAKQEILSVAAETSTTVEAISANVSDHASLENIAKKIANLNERTILFNCAGIPYTLEYNRIPMDVYEKLCKTNLLGSMYISRAFLPHMEDGTIVLCSSALGQVGMYGYTAYAPTKFALRGFAEALHSELVKSKPGVSIQLAFPVDTDTPGYEEELKTMPEITKQLNDAGGLAKPEE